MKQSPLPVAMHAETSGQSQYMMQLNSQVRYFWHLIILNAHKFTTFLRDVNYFIQSNSAVLSPAHDKLALTWQVRKKRWVNRLFRNQLPLLESV